MNRPLRLTECFVGVFGMFATYFVGGRCIINNPFRMPSRNVRNVLVICMLHIRRVKVWFLRCKSGFLHAKNPFLFFVSITNTLLMCYEYSVKWLRTFRQAQGTDSSCPYPCVTKNVYSRHQIRISTLLNMCIHFITRTFPHYQIRIFTSSNTCFHIIKYVYSFHRTHISVCHFVGVFIYAGAINRSPTAANGLR